MTISEFPIYLIDVVLNSIAINIKPEPGNKASKCKKPDLA